MSLTDEEIVRKIQEGELEEFREIVRRYEAKLHYYAFRILGDKDMAEDAIQESFIKAYKNINSFDIRKKFSSWMYRIVHNESINLYHKNKDHLSIEDFHETLSNGETERSVQKRIDLKKNREILDKAVSTLPIKYREVIILRYFEDKSYEEISEILRMPANTVGTFINRGKKELKNHFKNIDFEELL